jgi:hypothetical protein
MITSTQVHKLNLFLLHTPQWKDHDGAKSYWTKGNSGGSQAYQTAIPRMRLMYGVGILIA